MLLAPKWQHVPTHAQPKWSFQFFHVEVLAFPWCQRSQALQLVTYCQEVCSEKVLPPEQVVVMILLAYAAQ